MLVKCEIAALIKIRLKVNIWDEHVIIPHSLNSLMQLSCEFIKQSSEIFLQASQKTFQISSLDVACLLLQSLSGRSHTASIMLIFGHCGGKSNADSVPLCVFLSSNTFTVLAVSWGSLSWQLSHCQSHTFQMVLHCRSKSDGTFPQYSFFYYNTTYWHSA